MTPQERDELFRAIDDYRGSSDLDREAADLTAPREPRVNPTTGSPGLEYLNRSEERDRLSNSEQAAREERLHQRELDRQAEVAKIDAERRKAVAEAKANADAENSKVKVKGRVDRQNDKEAAKNNGTRKTIWDALITRINASFEKWKIRRQQRQAANANGQKPKKGLARLGGLGGFGAGLWFTGATLGAAGGLLFALPTYWLVKKLRNRGAKKDAAAGASAHSESFAPATEARVEPAQPSAPESSGPEGRRSANRPRSFSRPSPVSASRRFNMARPAFARH